MMMDQNSHEKGGMLIYDDVIDVKYQNCSKYLFKFSNLFLKQDDGKGEIITKSKSQIPNEKKKLKNGGMFPFRYRKKNS